MGATVRRTVVSGVEGIVLENSRVRAVVVPSLGGRVWELEDRARGRQWIWHRDDVALKATAPGAAYDDVWAGGWEELFPNDAPGEFEGRALPDHGEWWTLPWSVTDTSEGEEAVVRIESETTVRRTTSVKEFRLRADENSVRVSYSIRSHEREGFHFLFKQHLPIALTPWCELRLPGGLVTPVDSSFGTFMREPGPREWPHVRGSDGRSIDLRKVPPASSGTREFVYVSGITEAWCGVDDLEARASLRLRSELARMPYVWLFLTYGGWRNCYTAVLEPCSNMPKALPDAVHAGHSAFLPAGGVFETSAEVTLGGLNSAH